ncbi:hypothetical protein AWH63_10865 [Marinobacter sp. C18]|uniref:hypothetical protein n=1 Tax=Marinobacter sp. C18 TaxID=1772288 RepID=UPI000949061F|nr:hypothetical protein [Marinobacter sp. C18]OLF82032.1 hypothetical protein AWH63_10865 [Marinobacter sp. C18]
MDSNEARNEIARRLKASSLTPVIYQPTEAMRQQSHIAVWVNHFPLILCGRYEHPASMQVAEELARHPRLADLIRSVGQPMKDCRTGIIHGKSICWQHDTSAIAISSPGELEQGRSEGRMVAIVLGDPRQSITAGLCIDSELEAIINKDAQSESLLDLETATEDTPGPGL